MKKTALVKALVAALILSLCLGSVGCIKIYTSPEAEAAAAPTAGASTVTPMPAGGTLLLKVNPQIAVSYDDAGNTTDVSAVNEDGARIIQGYTGYKGKACCDVVSELVGKIDQAGYFVEEIGGQPRQIVIEVEQGSSMPSADFLDGIVGQVQGYVQNRQMSNPVNVQGASVYGLQNYAMPSAAPSYNAASYGNTLYDDAATLYDDIIGNTLYDNDGIAGNTLYDTDTPYDDDIQGNTLYENDGIAGNTLYDTDTPYDSNSGYSYSSGNSGYSSYSYSSSGYSSYGGSGYSGYDD